MGGPLASEPRLALRQRHRHRRCRAAGRNFEIKPYGISAARPPIALRIPPVSNDLDGERRPRREVRHHRQSDRRLHLQHRLRAGGGGRAAGEPDALQPVLSREARFLPRGPRHLRLRPRRRQRQPGRRRRARQRLQRAIGHAVPVLQPAHRPEPRPRGADRGRRAPDRQGRQVRPRRAEHPGRRRTGDARRRRPTSRCCA